MSPMKQRPHQLGRSHSSIVLYELHCLFFCPFPLSQHLSGNTGATVSEFTIQQEDLGLVTVLVALTKYLTETTSWKIRKQRVWQNPRQTYPARPTPVMHLGLGYHFPKQHHECETEYSNTGTCEGHLHSNHNRPQPAKVPAPQFTQKGTENKLPWCAHLDPIRRGGTSQKIWQCLTYLSLVLFPSRHTEGCRWTYTDWS